MPDRETKQPNNVFISAVSSEFAAVRTALATSLGRANRRPQYHDELRYGSNRLLTDLENEIASCALAVFILGKRSGGGFPTAAETEGFDHLLPQGETRASYTQWEFLLAGKHRLRRLVYEPAAGFTQDPPPPDAHADDDPALQARFVTRLSGSGIARTSFSTLAELRALMQEQLDKTAEAFHRLPASIGDIFKGRSKFLVDLHAALARDSAAAVTAVHGLGGVGKTRAAIEYAHAHSADYPGGRALVAAGGADALTSTLATTLGLTDLLELPEDARRKQLCDWLNQRGDWLLILDGADSAEAIGAIDRLREGLNTGRVLVTSRRTELPLGCVALALDVLAIPDAAALLLAGTEGTRRRADDDATQAEALATDLGGLALALTHAVAYIRQRKISLAAYRARLAETPRTVTDFVAPQITGYDKSIDATLALTVAQLTPDGRTLLERLSFLANDPVPETLLSRDVLGDGADAAEAALADLDAWSLASRNPDDGSFTIHRLVREVTRLGLSPDAARDRLDQALHWVNAAFVGNPQDVRTWPRLLPLAEHAETVADRAEAAGIDEPTGRLMTALGVLFHARAQYARAERLKRAALAIGERSLGPDHPDVATRLNNLALLLRATNRLAEAEPLFRRALVIDEASLGPDHPEIAIGLNNLAGLLRATNRLAEAEPLYRRALAIDEASLGPDHPNVAIRLNNLAVLLEATNRVAEAEPLYRRVVTIFEASLGPDHPNVATSLNNLADTFRATGRLAEAEPLFRRALAIDEASLGLDHPEVATDLNNLALLLQATNRVAEAEPLSRRHLLIYLKFQRATGHAHPHRDQAVANYAAILQALGRTHEAIIAELRALLAEAGLEGL